MIDQLIVSGCSFTQGHSWADHLNMPNVVNLANGGAGNTYICRRTLNYLDNYHGDPRHTLVIVMWSGTSRIDVSVSKEWYGHIRSSGKIGWSDGTSHWIHSGSSGHVPELTDVCKVTDNQSLCIDSLQNFILLETYLQAKGYPYLFTSYANYWSEQDEYCSSTSVDPNIGYHCRHLPLYQNFDFSHWIFVNSHRDCLGEYAIDDLRHRDDSHPGPETHRGFAAEVLMPAIEIFL